MGLTYFFTQALKTFNGPNTICHPYECHCVSKENIQTKKNKTTTTKPKPKKSKPFQKKLYIAQTQTKNIWIRDRF